jgi:hypothetical protein
MGIRKSWGITETGYVNKDPKFLSEVQDKVWNDPALKARDGKTFCNLAWLKICQGLGCRDFDPPPLQEPYTADGIWWFFQRKENANKWLEKDLANVQDLANQGCLIACILPSWMLGEAHGHIVSLTSGTLVWSESLQKFVPVCMNIGSAPLSSRRIGINMAFPMKRLNEEKKPQPKFYAWKELL